MAVKGETEKDRLSSLPNDILIGIISRLPFRLAVVTSCLSRRWRCLWPNMISININNNSRSGYTREFSKKLGEIMMQITSPVIHSFTIESHFLFRNGVFYPYMDSLFRQICDRNIRELKLTGFMDVCYKLTLPSFIFQTSSLVSVELDSSIRWQLPKESDSINLPNLKNLRIEFHVWQCDCIGKLVKACPALEELSVTTFEFNGRRGYFTCSNQNLRRLIMNFDRTRRMDIRIDSHKLEYLAFFSSDSWTLRFEEEPIGLREVKIESNNRRNYRLLKEKNRSSIRFKSAIANVQVLSMDVFAVYNTSTVFYNVTQLTVNMDLSHNIQILLLSMELCPTLDALTLKFCGTDRHDEQQFVLPNPDHASALLRGLKRIEIDIGWVSYSTPSKTFLDLVEYLLRNAVNLEYFGFKVPDDWCCYKGYVEQTQRKELNFCKLLYQCPTASMRCEVEYVGKFFKMSRKAGPKVTGANGGVIPFNCTPWNGFTFEEEE